jgi:glutathione S-transferase
MIANFAINVNSDKGLKLWPHEAAPKGDLQACQRTADHQCAMQECDKLTMSPYWKPYMEKFTVNESMDAYTANCPAIEEFFKKCMGGHEYLSGTDQPMYIDIHCYVMCEMLASLKYSVYKSQYEYMKIDENLPTVIAWVERMRAHPSFKDHVWSRDAFAKMQTL